MTFRPVSLAVLALALAGISGGAIAAEQNYFRYRGDSTATGSPAAGTNNGGTTAPAPTPLTVTGPSSQRVRTGSNLATPASSASGTSLPVTWSFSPVGATPPSWATVDPGTGVVSGPAGAASTFSGLVLQASDGKSTGQSAPFSIDVLAPPTATVAAADLTKRVRVGSNLSIQPVPTGILGSASWTYGTLTGTLPGGLALESGSGLVHGTVTRAGDARFTLRVQDSSDKTTADTAQVSVTAMAPLAFTTQPGQVTGETLSPVSQTAPVVANVLAPTTTPATYALQSSDGTDVSANFGNTCQGLSFSTSTGRVTGTPQAACSPTGLKVVVTDPADTTTPTSSPFAANVTVASTVTLDPNKTNAGFKLSNGNLTATNNSGGRITTMATVGHKNGDGNFYWEAQTSGLDAGDDTNIGLTSDYTKIVSDNGSGGPGWSFAPSYNVIAENATFKVGMPNAPRSADTVMVAWNGATLWFGMNGTWLNGDPVAGTGGYGFNPGTRLVYPAVSLGKVGSQVTVGFRALKYGPPAGYTSWR